jgi:hypothetical protein
MVETRRQSGKLPPPLREVQASDEVNPSEEDYELESESQSDSGSEWGDDSPRWCSTSSVPYKNLDWFLSSRKTGKTYRKTRQDNGQTINLNRQDEETKT